MAFGNDSSPNKIMRFRHDSLMLRTNLHSSFGYHAQKLSGEPWVTVVNQVPFSGQDSVLRIREIPGNLAHPQPVRRPCDPGNFHLACSQVDEEQHHEPLQTSPGPHFHSEEIRGHNHLPMPAQELLPRRLPAPLRCRLDPVSFQDPSDRAAGKLVSKIGERTLDSSIAPIPVLLCHAHHQSRDLISGTWPTR